MKNRKKIAIAVVLTLVVAGTLAGVAGVAGTPGEVKRAWVNSDGIVDVSKVPERYGVLDHTGAHVGFIETRHLYGEDDVYPQPVIDADGNLIGHIGDNGFWALGGEEPVLEGAYSAVEEYGASGELIHKQVFGQSPD